MLAPFDHLLAVLLLLVFPGWVLRNGAREMRELAENPADRLGMYRKTMLVQWSTTLVIVWIWWSDERAWSDLGLGMQWQPGLFVALAVAVAALLLMRRQLMQVRRDPAVAARIRDQAHEMRGLVPTTAREVWGFRAMALTAGVCEELAFRGFILFYLSTFVPMAVAVLAMMVAFGCAHLYQGWIPAMQIAVIGGIAASLYLLSGSLWIPIVLHVALDMFQLSVVHAARINAGSPEPAGSS